MLPSRKAPRADAGFTLAEVCVAMALLALTASGVAALCDVATRSAQQARAQTSATVLAIQKLEQLRALRWTVDRDGARQSDGSSDLAVEPFTASGSGLAATPPDALDANIEGCVDYLDARGHWAGAGAVPPAAAQYIRRWSIRPLPENPGDSLMLQVLVTTVERDRQARRPRQRLAGDALVTTVLTRREP